MPSLDKDLMLRRLKWEHIDTLKLPSNSAIDLIQVGKDTTWTNGYLLHIEKRDGPQIEGVRLVRKTKDGQDETVISDWGFVEVSDPNAPNSIALTLWSPEITPYRVMLRK